MNFHCKYKYKTTGFETSVALNVKRNPGYSDGCVLHIRQYLKTDHYLGPLFVSKIKAYFLYEVTLYFLSKFVYLQS
jgi:hypothetical protein